VASHHTLTGVVGFVGVGVDEVRSHSGRVVGRKDGLAVDALCLLHSPVGTLRTWIHSKLCRRGMLDFFNIPYLEPAVVRSACIILILEE
jgi:hypothetical protein